jgi:DNA-binding CsgD family transcriptional regulator
LGREAEFLNVIELVYASALDGTQWPAFLDASAQLFGSVGASFEYIDKITGRPLLLELSSDISADSSPEYMEYYGSISPRVKNGLCAKAGTISYDYAILTEAEMDADEYYSEFQGAHGLRYFVAGHLVNSDKYFSAFAIQRTPQQGHVGNDEIALMQRLMPHVKQAVDLRWRLSDADVLRRSLLEDLEDLADPTLLIEASGAVFYANRAAQTLFAAGDGVKVTDNVVQFADKTAARQFDSALSGMIGIKSDGVDVAPYGFAAHRPSGKRPYFVAMRPLPSYNQYSVPTARSVAAIVFIRDPSIFIRLDAEVLKQSYRLTSAELDIAIAVDNGHSIREVAERRGVSISTVRSQLYGLMSKMAVKRQSDLMHLLGQYRRPFI